MKNYKPAHDLGYFTPDEIREKKDFIKSIISLKSSLPARDENTLNLLKKLLSKEDEILECGPGNGFLLNKLCGGGYRNISASDIDDYMTQIPRSSLKSFRIVDFSFDKLPWGDQSFNGVISFETMEHLENPFFFMREVHRVLKPDGIFVGSMPNGLHLFNRLTFLLKGDLAFWHEKNNHIAFFQSKGLWNKSVLKYFDVQKIVWYHGIFPYRFLRKIPFPTTKLFARSFIFVLKKKITY